MRYEEPLPSVRGGRSGRLSERITRSMFSVTLLELDLDDKTYTVRERTFNEPEKFIREVTDEHYMEVTNYMVLHHASKEELEVARNAMQSLAKLNNRK